MESLPTQYQSSKGLIDIDSMAYPHLTNAIRKMEAEGKSSDPVLAALLARKKFMDDTLDAATESAPVAKAEEGHNKPPATSTLERVREAVEDIRIEALNWMDGAEIANAAQAAEVEKLLDMLRDAKADGEKAKDVEKKPHMDAAQKVQDAYNAIFGQTQKVTGTAVVIESAVKAALTKWRKKLEADRQAEVARLAKIAEDQAEKAREAFKASSDSSDLAQREESLAEIDAARQAAFALSSVTKSTTKGLRTVYDVEIVDGKALAAWFWVNRKAELMEFMTDEARRTVRAVSGNVTINGVNVTSEKVAV